MRAFPGRYAPQTCAGACAGRRAPDLLGPSVHSICNMPGDGSRHLQMRHISETIKWVPGSAGSVWPKIKQTLRPPGFMQSDKQTKLRSRAFW